MIKLDILSDPICPWCYIGKAALDAALANHPDHPFAIEWHPFQLNPDMPAGGMDRVEYLEHKFGGREGAMRAYAPVVERAEAMGLPLNLPAVARTPNTLNAHRLIHWAGIEGRQTPVVSFLFQAYFQDGQDIGDTDVLVQVAERAEMNGAAIRRLLAGDADAQLTRDRDAHARQRGVTGVPTFVVANAHVVVGAQPPELWDRVINELTAPRPDDAPLQ
ncbi:DsbA family protein [Actibacterium sp. XHP0104]|uniref:DsbA family oxidoreductase n=1 Tax=Actibacterium sp. XHP0104 TaxID=2984335 RepID=UPI0021E82B72|nr:DsbA family oxidoreductase [Actibacterium sp. XHP0104]MCV2881079.1 DsbA family oxidoreductase [Actibacterium sp. XHP0104]